jgi:Protein of unknown function DUF262/RiboL-PSP-HEPN
MPNNSAPSPATPAIRDDDVAKDEYELALEQDVEDEALLEDPGARKFSISSYGADYTVDSLVKRMRDGAFKIPKFQRKFVWTLKHSSKFIESLLMGLPVPGIFLYKEADTNEHLVIGSPTEVFVVLICGFVERSVEIVIMEKIEQRAHPRVQKFIRGYFKTGTNYNCDAIAQLLERFDLEWSEKFRDLLKTRDDLIEALRSAYALRNSIAHGGTANCGLSGVQELYRSAKEVVAALGAATTAQSFPSG